jgi:Catalytic LigB subunit of aromatic ring-opening dioxygenase
MAEILGIGTTHRPVMLRGDAGWTFGLKLALADPDLPAEWKDPARWPARMREELGNDFGVAEAGRQRQLFRRHFAAARRALDDFKPDVVVMWGDDQHENFQEDLIPPFAVLAYDDRTIHPWQERNNTENPWGEPVDFTYRVRGHRAAGKYLAAGLIEAGFDMPYALKPLHHDLAHAFKNTVLLLDDARTGFDYPLVPFHVNCYGRRVNAAEGLRLPLALRDRLKDLDPPSPNPRRCMEVGAAVARVMAASPWRTALVASSSWSHSFLTEKHYQLWPDVEADKRFYRALTEGDYETWRQTTTDAIEDSGHHELLNWFCLVGAMEALGRRKPDSSVFLETYAFVSCAVFAYYRP